MTFYLGFITLLTDPIFRGPVIGSLLMSLATALVGAVVFVRRKSLIGETLSHATFPGVALGVIVAEVVCPDQEGLALLIVLGGALITGLLGQICIEFLLKNRQKADSALCYVLSSFLGVGVVLSSYLQQSHVAWYRKVQLFFYGQAATMTDVHIYIYGALSLGVCLAIIFIYRPLQISCFDTVFGESIGVRSRLISQCIAWLLCIAIVIGIRTVGVVLMTGMLIAPAVAARYLTSRFSTFLHMSAVIGVVSAFVGNYVASEMIMPRSHQGYLPTGPVTVIIASSVAFLSLLFAPKRGSVMKMLRRYRFQRSCVVENLLKAFWRQDQEKVSLEQVYDWGVARRGLVHRTLSKLKREGWVQSPSKHCYHLTEDGRKRAAYIVRLHRLWELYLVEHLGSPLTHIHRSAEEMEHFITPTIENKLTKLLLNPTQDPHNQPIPQKELL